MMDAKDEIRRHYEPRISPDVPNYLVLDWASARSQRARFRVLVKNLKLRRKSLLDVGSGLGDLLAYLQRKKIPVEYTGVDILDTMVEAAGKRHPNGRFLCADLFEENPFEPRSFDVVFCSGLFNLNLGNNHDFLPLGLRRLVELAREHAVFNMLHRRAKGSDDRYAYYDPQEVLELLAPMNCRTRLIDDYLPNDFTVICSI